MKVSILRLDPDLPRPARAHPNDAGMDLLSAEDITLAPGERAAVATGIAVAIDDGYAGFVHARSGRALREGLALVNAPGVIDAGYRGEVKVILVNLDPDEKISIKRGDKIAQLVIQAVEIVDPDEVDELPGSHRGQGGFGSTGA
jgi:dUTP pyrophosphatase